MTAFEDRVFHTLIHTSDHQKEPALDHVFRSAPRRNALASLARLRERIEEQEHPIRTWTEVWVVEHQVFERYLALMTEQEQTFARLQHSDWLSELKHTADKHDDFNHAHAWAYITLGTISAAKIANDTISSAQI